MGLFGAPPSLNFFMEYALPSFTPPTHEEPIRTKVRPLNYFRLTWAASVVRVNGTFTSVRSPAVELLEAAGEHGTDYFLGGHGPYVISDELAAELESAGFDTTADLGYGIGPYGGEGFGY